MAYLAGRVASGRASDEELRQAARIIIALVRTLPDGSVVEIGDEGEPAER
jgi:hypothetical protein